MKILGKQTDINSISSIHTVNEKTKKMVKLGLEPIWSKRLAAYVNTSMSYVHTMTYENNIYRLQMERDNTIPKLKLYWSTDNGLTYSSKVIFVGSYGDDEIPSKVRVTSAYFTRSNYISSRSNGPIYALCGKGLWTINIGDLTNITSEFQDRPSEFTDAEFEKNSFMFLRNPRSASDPTGAVICVYAYTYSGGQYRVDLAMNYYSNQYRREWACLTTSYKFDSQLDSRNTPMMKWDNDSNFCRIPTTNLTVINGVVKALRISGANFVESPTFEQITIPTPELDFVPYFANVISVGSNELLVNVKDSSPIPAQKSKIYFVKTNDWGATWSVVNTDIDAFNIYNYSYTIANVNNTYTIFGNTLTDPGNTCNRYTSSNLSTWTKENDVVATTNAISAIITYYKDRYHIHSGVGITTSYFALMEAGGDISNQVAIALYDYLPFQPKTEFVSGEGTVVEKNGSIVKISGTPYQAGTNVTIVDGQGGVKTINANDTTYTAGQGITIDENNVISSSITAAGISVEATEGGTTWTSEPVVISGIGEVD